MEFQPVVVVSEVTEVEDNKDLIREEVKDELEFKVTENFLGDTVIWARKKFKRAKNEK